MLITLWALIPVRGYYNTSEGAYYSGGINSCEGVLIPPRVLITPRVLVPWRVLITLRALIPVRGC